MPSWLSLQNAKKAATPQSKAAINRRTPWFLGVREFITALDAFLALVAKRQRKRLRRNLKRRSIAALQRGSPWMAHCHQPLDRAKDDNSVRDGGRGQCGFIQVADRQLLVLATGLQYDHVPCFADEVDAAIGSNG